MKKIITICAIVFALGFGLSVAGQFAGGELYGSYYDGSLHSVRESVLDAGDFVRTHVRDGLRYRTWSDDDGYRHSGWFFDDDWDGDWDDDLDAYADDLADSIEDSVTRSIEGSIGSIPAPDIDKLEFSFDSGSYRIVEGDEFDCSGAIVRSSEMHGGTWELSLRRKNSTEMTITLPKETFEKLECNVGAASVIIDIPLAVDKAEFNIGAGKLTAAQPLDAAKVEVECGAGSVSLELAGSAEEYGYEIAVAMGRVSLNDNKLASGIVGTRRIERDGARMLELNVGAGAIDLFTEE